MSARGPVSWPVYAYGLSLAIAVVMVVAVILYTSAHCTSVLAAAGTPGACGLGVGWLLFALAFILIAAYSAWELLRAIRAVKRTA